MAELSDHARLGLCVFACAASRSLIHENQISLLVYMMSHLDINLKHVGARLWSILMAAGGVPMLLSVDDVHTVSPTPCGVPHKQERNTMNPNDTPKTPTLDRSGCEVSEISIAQLVGEVYEFAPPAERGRLLEHLLRRKGRVQTRTMLMEAVWDIHYDPMTNVVDTHISRLRGKVDKPFDTDLIETVRGSGYRIDAP